MTMQQSDSAIAYFQKTLDLAPEPQMAAKAKEFIEELGG